MSATTPYHLDESNIPHQPLVLFTQWMEDALAANLPEPNAMTLATVTPAGTPSARVVLLRGFDERGFVFYTNYQSRKANELLTNPHAALVFFWARIERQIRVEGQVHKVSREESDAYFRSRPRGHQMGAVVSPQSQVIEGRSFLESRLERVITDVGDHEVPRPEHWGGYRVVPQMMEFWLGQPNRLHDRIRYRHDEFGQWLIDRLAP